VKFLKYHRYKICFDIGGKIITFTCEVIEDSFEENSFVTFKDKFDEILTYNKNNIISVQEVKNE